MVSFPTYKPVITPLCNKFNIVTSADSSYYPHVYLFLCNLKSFKVNIDITVMDCGLTNNQKFCLIKLGATIKNFTHHTIKKYSLLQLPFVERPYINTIVEDKGADTHVMWIDADCFIQSPGFFRYAEKVIKSRKFGAVYECHSQYMKSLNYTESKNWMTNLGVKHFGNELGRHIFERAVINSGVIIANIHSPIWKMWQDAQNYILATNDYFFGVDQIALNYACIKNAVDFFPVTPLMNWMANVCVPVIKNNVFMVPDTEETIYNVHFAGKTKNFVTLVEKIIKETNPTFEHCSAEYQDAKIR